MKKNLVFWLGVGLLVLVISGCSPQGEPAQVPVSDTTTEYLVEVVEAPIIKTAATSGTCPELPTQTYPVSGSLSDVVRDATGAYPSMINSCFAIFNTTHGNRTNMLYVRNGWGLLNLPVEIFTPWDGDTYIVGDPASVAAKATVDEDTVIVEGGVDNFTQDGNLIRKMDWSTVKGGIYIHEVMFESDRLKVDSDNNRFWTAYCEGKEFDNSHLDQALACGRGE